MEVTKDCGQCHKKCTRNEFSHKQWRTKSHPSCRRCSEYSKISKDTSRKCRDCKFELPRTKFAIHQWGKGDEARCYACAEKLGHKILSSINMDGGGDDDHLGIGMGMNKTKELTDGTIVCGAHSKESCDICMMDFTLTNDYQRKRNELGRDELTPEETEQVSKDFFEAANIRIRKKVCIMDGHPVCPRSNRVLGCECREVTYCSPACQEHHWTIHKMTCKHHCKKMEEKQKKEGKERQKETKSAHTSRSKSVANNLTEEQKNFVRKEAFFAENNGGEHSIEECAWQLGEHPFVIGGGSIRYGRNGEEFIKGDVAEIYREKLGVEWDGSPRFGLGPYVQQKTPVDWIAKARQGKSQKMKDLEKELMMMTGLNLNL